VHRLAVRTGACPHASPHGAPLLGGHPQVEARPQLLLLERAEDGLERAGALLRVQGRPPVFEGHPRAAVPGLGDDAQPGPPCACLRMGGEGVEHVLEPLPVQDDLRQSRRGLQRHPPEGGLMQRQGRPRLRRHGHGGPLGAEEIEQGLLQREGAVGVAEDDLGGPPAPLVQGHPAGRQEGGPGADVGEDAAQIMKREGQESNALLGRQRHHTWKGGAGPPHAQRPGGRRRGQGNTSRGAHGWPRRTPGRGSTPRAERVLAVDDDADILETLSEILELEGFLVTRARNGEEALAELTRAPVDLVLLDLVMPVMNGWEFSRRLPLRPEGDRPPVLVVSADRNVAQKARETGAVGWVGKPFDLDALLARIREVIPP